MEKRVKFLDSKKTKVIAIGYNDVESASEGVKEFLSEHGDKPYEHNKEQDGDTNNDFGPVFYFDVLGY